MTYAEVRFWLTWNAFLILLPKFKVEILNISGYEYKTSLIPGVHTII